jgi:hypothetical protein
MQALNNVQDCESFSGRTVVTRGRTVLARLAGVLLGFPSPGADVPTQVTKTRIRSGEIWERDFGGRRMSSRLTGARDGHVCERFGALKFELELAVEESIVHWPLRRGWLLGVPIPKFMLPISKTREFTRDGVFHFDVGLYLPITNALIIRYEGWLKPDFERHPN